MIRRVLGASWLSIALLLGACGGGGGGGPTMVVVPSVTGLTQAAATAAITAAGLTDTVTTRSSSTVATGTVISQTPAAGANVATGSATALVVSSGPPPVPGPNVVGLTQPAATTAITGASLTVGVVTMQPSTTVAAGVVLSQNPAAAATAPTGTAVALVVSAGPLVAVPGVVGLTQAAAATAINAAGLVLGSVSTQSSTTVAAGTVISQVPTAAASVAAGSSVNLVVSSGTAPANSLAVLVDSGPAVLAANGEIAANTVYASITICTPGSASACQTIDHIEIDTGSVGLQILAETVNNSVTPAPIMDSGTGTPLRECVQFADGYSWGSMVVVDVTIGQRRISNLPVHLIGDLAAGVAPSSCVLGAAENTVVQFGANGILGVGYWNEDCGSYCVTTAPSGAYYACPNNVCAPTVVPLSKQLKNPVALMASDNNGVMLSLPSVAAPGATSVAGTLYFGVGTQADNAIGSAQLFTVNGTGDLVTVFNGATDSNSFIDSGSNAYFFSSSITVCTTAKSFYCPANSTPKNATIQGQNGTTSAVSFTVDNAESLFSTPGLTAFPTLGGSTPSSGGTSVGFDWGLPFFFGRNVYVLFENGTINGTQGPASLF